MTKEILILNKRGLTAASQSFTVAGTVRLHIGKIKKREILSPIKVLAEFAMKRFRLAL